MSNSDEETVSVALSKAAKGRLTTLMRKRGVIQKTGFGRLLAWFEKQDAVPLLESPLEDD